MGEVCTMQYAVCSNTVILKSDVELVVPEQDTRSSRHPCRLREAELEVDSWLFFYCSSFSILNPHKVSALHYVTINCGAIIMIQQYH